MNACSHSTSKYSICSTSIRAGTPSRSTSTWPSAVVNVNQSYVERGGTTGAHGSPVYFLAKDGSDWEIAAAQNTVVVEVG